MLVTIKNGKRTLKLTKRELEMLEATQGIIADIARDYAASDGDQRDRFENAAISIAEITACATKPTKEPALAGK